MLTDNWLNPSIELSKLYKSFTGYIGAVDNIYIFTYIPKDK